MKKILSLLALSSLLSFKAQAAPVNLSLIGTASTDSLFESQLPTNLCIGFIHCGSQTLKGLAVSYGSNTVRDSADGALLAIGLNVVEGDSRGLQFSFITNINAGRFAGLQTSFYNVNAGEEFAGMQLGFLGNYNGGRAAGAQLSVFSNVQTNAMSGLQFSLANVLAAGAKEDEKVSDFAVQLGLVNVSTQENVISIGLINVIKGGRLGLSLDTGMFHYNRLTFVSGSKYLYSILQLDDHVLNPDKKNDYHPNRIGVIGFGLGLAIPLSEKFTVRYEYCRYSPTSYERDSGSLWRLLGEYKANRFVALHAGLERFRFEDNYFSAQLSNHRDNYALTAGVSFNIMGVSL